MISSAMPVHKNIFRFFVTVFCIITSVVVCGKEVRPSETPNKNILCGQDALLKNLEGTWSDEKFISILNRTKSWSDALNDRHSNVTSINIKNTKIYFTFSWHESSNSDEWGTANTVCVKKDGDKIWFTGDKGAKFEGPFVKIGSSDSEEQLYLAQFWNGCYKSQLSETWCFSKNGITIDNKLIPAHLVKDLSETPAYGTIFLVDAQIPPFIIFVPKNDGGWLVYKDDWASSENYAPVKVGKDSPWRSLIKEK